MIPFGALLAGAPGGFEDALNKARQAEQQQRRQRMARTAAMAGPNMGALYGGPPGAGPPGAGPPAEAGPPAGADVPPASPDDEPSPMFPGPPATFAQRFDAIRQPQAPPGPPQQPQAPPGPPPPQQRLPPTPGSPPQQALPGPPPQALPTTPGPPQRSTQLPTTPGPPQMLDREAVKRQIYNQNPQHWNAMGRRGMTELDKAADLQIRQMQAQQKAAAKAAPVGELNPNRVQEGIGYYNKYQEMPKWLTQKSRNDPTRRAYENAILSGAPAAAQQSGDEVRLDPIQRQKEARWENANRVGYQGFSGAAGHVNQLEQAYNDLKQSGLAGQFPAWSAFKANVERVLGGVSDTELKAIGGWLGPEFVKGITGRAGTGMERGEWVDFLSKLKSPEQFEKMIHAMREGIKVQMDGFVASYRGEVKTSEEDARKRIMMHISKPAQQIMQPSMPPPSVPTRERYEIVQ